MDRTGIAITAAVAVLAFAWFTRGRWLPVIAPLYGKVLNGAAGTPASTAGTGTGALVMAGSILAPSGKSVNDPFASGEWANQFLHGLS